MKIVDDSGSDIEDLIQTAEKTEEKSRHQVEPDVEMKEQKEEEVKQEPIEKLEQEFEPTPVESKHEKIEKSEKSENKSEKSEKSEKQVKPKPKAIKQKTNEQVEDLPSRRSLRRNAEEKEKD